MILHISKCLPQDLTKETAFPVIFYCCISSCHRLRGYKQHTFVSQLPSADRAWLGPVPQGPTRLRARHWPGPQRHQRLKWGKIPLQAPSGRWQDSTPYTCWGEVLCFFCWLLARARLRQSRPPAVSFHEKPPVPTACFFKASGRIPLFSLQRQSLM